MNIVVSKDEWEDLARLVDEARDQLLLANKTVSLEIHDEALEEAIHLLTHVIFCHAWHPSA